jgi:hypothetical protein
MGLRLRWLLKKMPELPDVPEDDPATLSVDMGVDLTPL